MKYRISEVAGMTGVAVHRIEYAVRRQQIEIDRPIKSLGLFEVRVALHPEVRVAVVVNVARSADEAELQRQRGGMITADMLEQAERETAETEAAGQPPEAAA